VSNRVCESFNQENEGIPKHVLLQKSYARKLHLEHLFLGKLLYYFISEGIHDHQFKFGMPSENYLCLMSALLMFGLPQKDNQDIRICQVLSHSEQLSFHRSLSIVD
jgi:hypothetical protein